MKKLLNNNHADLNMVLTAIVIAITLAIGLIITFNVLAALDTTTVDASFGDANETPAANATTDLQTNIETFYTVAPIILIVLAAVGILGYVLLLKRR